MIIGIDASALTLSHPTGVQRYTEYIIKHMLEVGKEHTFRLYTPKPLPEPFRAHQVIITSPRYWTQIRLPIELLIHKPDVFFQPAYMLPPFCPVPGVITVHDFGWVKFPKAYTEAQLGLEHLSISRIARQKPHVIVPSLSAQTDLLDTYHISPNLIHVIPEALIALPEIQLSDFPEVLRHKKRDIVLAVGRLEERKNVKTLIKAMALLINKTNVTENKTGMEAPLLVLIGQAGYGAEDIFASIKHAKEAGLEVIHRNNADDQELAAWFKIAKVFVYPSLYEGFGLPILQAFQAKVPVVTTHVSSIPEVAGEAVQYIHNPKDEDEIAAAINSVLYNKDKAEKLVALGEKRLQEFSWHKAAEKTLKILTQDSSLIEQKYGTISK